MNATERLGDTTLTFNQLLFIYYYYFLFLRKRAHYKKKFNFYKNTKSRVVQAFYIKKKKHWHD